MRPDELNRRDFHKLSAAALSGLLAGVAGCGEENAKPTGAAKDKSAQSGAVSLAKEANKSEPAKVTTVAEHACRGLNECKGQGKNEKNACAGQGTCFTVQHTCSHQNSCKNLGGCGEHYGTNDCKEKGGCGMFPIPAKPWDKAREAFEGRMKTAGKTVGKAPAPTKS